MIKTFRWFGLLAFLVLSGCGGSGTGANVPSFSSLSPGVNIQIKNAATGEITMVLNENEQANAFVRLLDDNYILIKNREVTISTTVGQVSHSSLVTGSLGDVSFILIAPDISGTAPVTGQLSVSYVSDADTGSIKTGTLDFVVYPTN